MNKDITYSGRGIMAWNQYKGMRDLATVNRQGAINAGIFKDAPDFEKQTFHIGKVESDMEHTAGLVYLQEVMMTHFSKEKVIPPNQRKKYNIAGWLHEIGERKTGDNCDDGSRDDELLDELERHEVYRYCVESFPPKLAAKYYGWYLEFLYGNTQFGKGVKVFDKFECIYWAFHMESLGFIGNIRYKVDVLGKKEKDCNDVGCIKYTSTLNPLDNWLCNVLRTPGILEYKHIDCFLELAQSASYMVRGTTMKWLNEFLAAWEKGEIPPSLGRKERLALEKAAKEDEKAVAADNKGSPT